jgi:oxygen-independent coproporphyrinogen-3 oxidase
MPGLYVHIPFCAHKCGYCDFYSLAGRPGLIHVYIEALLSEAAGCRGMDFDTLYIGGGTPSLLGADLLKMLFGGLRKNFDLSHLVEATIECNPESTNADFLEAALSCGMNRLSIGVQSLDDRELKLAGRIHDSARAMAAVRQAFEVGFNNVSVDVIVGLPGQSLHSLEGTLDRLAEAGVSHISAYCLSIEEGTPFALHAPEGIADGDGQALLFEGVAASLDRRGFVHYEISNFARPNRECLHNLNYWRGGEYLGLGPSAASHLAGRRFRNAADLAEYLKVPGGTVVDQEELDARYKAAEEAVLRLRLLKEGLDAAALTALYGRDNTAGLVSRLEELRLRGLLEGQGDFYRLPPGGAMTSNRVFIEVIE